MGIQSSLMLLLVTLISEYHDVIYTCNFKLTSLSQISADDFVKLSDVMGFSKGVQMHLASLVNCRNECRRLCKCERALQK